VNEGKLGAKAGGGLFGAEPLLAANASAAFLKELEADYG